MMHVTLFLDVDHIDGPEVSSDVVARHIANSLTRGVFPVAVVPPLAVDAPSGRYRVVTADVLDINEHG